MSKLNHILGADIGKHCKCMHKSGAKEWARRRVGQISKIRIFLHIYIHSTHTQTHNTLEDQIYMIVANM